MFNVTIDGRVHEALFGLRLLDRTVNCHLHFHTFLKVNCHAWSLDSIRSKLSPASVVPEWRKGFSGGFLFVGIGGRRALDALSK